MMPMNSAWPIAATLALLLVGLIVQPGATAYESVEPDPLRRAQKLQAREYAARGDTVLVGWREGGRPELTPCPWP